MKEKCIKGVISVAALNATALDIYSILQDDKILYVWEAVLIRLLSEYFRVPYKILIPRDGEWGRKFPGGNWTGLLGMVSRSEVDLAVCGIGITEERFEDFNFSSPYLYSQMIFMTNKPKPISANFVLFRPFSWELWTSIGISFFTVLFLLFILTNRRKTFQKILFVLFGSLFGQSIILIKQRRTPRLFLSMWLILVFIITHSYKGLLLSFLSFPSYSGIRNIPNLAKAAEQNSVSCYTRKGHSILPILLESDFKTWRSIGKCLKRSVMKSGSPDKFFLKDTGTKAFLSQKIFIMHYEKKFLFSEESFFNTMHGFPVSKKFACQKNLNAFSRRIFEAGLISKLYKDVQLLTELRNQDSENTEEQNPRILGVADLKAAFLVLISGHTLALFILLLEIAIKRYFAY